MSVKNMDPCLSQQKNNSGFSTLEMLIALAVITTSVSTVIIVVFGNSLAVVNAQLATEALANAEQAMENSLAMAKADFYFSTTTSQSEAVTTIIFANSYTKQISSVATWQEEYSKNQQVSLNTLITNWREVAKGNICLLDAGDNWQHPRINTFVFGPDLIADSSGVNPISDISSFGKKLYVALAKTAVPAAPTFFIFDVSSSSAPSLQGSLDNTSSVAAGISAIVLSGNYAYIASARAISGSTGFGQLQIIDVSNAVTPRLVTTYRLSGVTGTSGQGIGSSIAFKDKYVYLGLTKTGSGPEFHIIDVHDPMHPFEVGNFSIGNTINAIAIENNYAYLAHPTDSTSQPSEQLTVLDITNPQNPLRVSGFHAPDNQGNGKSLQILGNVLYFGRTITNTANPELYLLNNTNATSISSTSPWSSKKISNSVNDLLIGSALLFVVTNNQFQIWNVSNPAAITQEANALSLPAPGAALSCSGRSVYAASASVSGAGFLSVVSPGS